MIDPALIPDFPNASKDFLALNPAFSRAGTPAKLERDIGNATLAKAQTQSRDSGRVCVRITSVRKRLLDPDNLCEKYHLDLCRYAGIIPGDTEEQITLSTNQRKCEKGEEEYVEIQIDFL